MVRTPLVGLKVARSADGNVTLATYADFQYGVMTVKGPALVTVCNGEASGSYGTDGVSGTDIGTQLHGVQLLPVMLAHLPAGTGAIELPAPDFNRFILAGGAPLGERLVM